MDIYQSSQRDHSFMIQPAIHPILDICKSIYSFHLTPTHAVMNKRAVFMTPLYAEYFTIIAVEKGTLTVRAIATVDTPSKDQTEAWYLQAGDLLVIHPNVELQLSYSEVGFLHIITCERYELMNDYTDRMSYELSYESLPEHGAIVHPQDERLFMLIQEIAQYMNQDIDHTHVILHELLQLLSSLNDYRHHKCLNRSMQQVASYIRYASEQLLTRENVAAQTRLHPHYFSEVFKKEIGYTFSDYLAIWRMNKAKEQLLCTDHTLHHIAEQIGYSDGIYLSKKFRSFTGMTPGTFRARKGTTRVASFPFAGTLLALGITPVVTALEINQYSMLIEEELSSVPIWHINKGDNQPPSEWKFELPATITEETKPDLIIVADCVLEHPQLYAQLREIAPLFIVEWGRRNHIDELLYLGQVLNRQVQAQEWIKRYQYQIETARHELALEHITEQTVGLYEIRGDHQIAIWGEGTRAGYNLYRSLKLHPPYPIRHEVFEAGGFKFIEEHLLPHYAADHMFVVAPAQWLENMESMMQQHPMWSQLPAVQNGQIYGLKLEEFAYDDGLALERQLHIQVGYLMQ
ncbi:helix-turn-helix domain-containing protein [Paenibacillus kyungheensis]